MGEGARCPWAKTEHEILYHDTEWCRPCRDDRALFELLELEGFQAGLSWKLILERRAALRAAFADFEPAALAGWGEDEVEAALAAPGVIKNRSKARCAVTNARAFLAVAEEWGSFARYLWHWVDGVPVDHRLERPEDMPAEDDLSRRVSADLKKLPLCGAGDCLLLPPGGGAHQRPSGDLPMARRGTIICRIACKIKRMVL